MLRKLAFVLVLVLTLAAKSPAQEPAPKPTTNAQKVHWHKYVNKEFGFSVRYPDTYRPTDGDDICKDDDFRRYLLCLERRDDSDAKIVVTIIIAQPFHVYPGSGDVMPTRQQIGGHVFYCGTVGSMGVGYAENCILNLKGKTLEFQFDLPEGPNFSEETRRLVRRMLITLRVSYCPISPLTGKVGTRSNFSDYRVNQDLSVALSGHPNVPRQSNA